MAEYNGFKIKRTHSLTPLTSVHEAEAVDGRPGRFALKVFHPPASTNVRRLYAIEGWLLAAERQQQAAKKDGTVVEVLAFGRCPEGAFAVLPWQEHFLEPWIKTLGAKGNTLRALAECLLNTIEAWEKETGGPHGNLKASNVFLKRTGPLVGMTAQLSDPAFMPGAKPEALQLADLAAVGTMLATIVRRRPPGAWPIEDAPEWKALGNAGKGWLDFCNYLLNPQPGEGEVTLAKARLRLKKVPKDANPVKMAALTLAAVLVVGAVGVVVFARFGNPGYMPDQIERLAIKLGNPQTLRSQITPKWGELCMAWDSWLGDLQSNGRRLLRTEGLIDANDTFRTDLENFLKTADALRPQEIVPEAKAEKRLGVLAKAPPQEVLNELLTNRVAIKVESAAAEVLTLATKLERWQRWDQLRELQKRLDEHKYTQVAGALGPKLPPVPGTEGYKLDAVRTLKLFNDISLDSTGTLPLAGRWSEISHLSDDMLKSGDRVQKEMPRIILERLEDKPSIGDFADSLVAPLDEMRQRRKQFLDPQVVRERFLKESELQQGPPEAVTADDFPKWDQELVAFSKVPRAEDPRFAPDMAAIAGPAPATAVDLEALAPAGEPGSPATLSKPDFDNELGGLQASLKTFQAREIVRRDVPAITTEKTKLTGVFQELLKRLEYTLTLLKPETWLAKVALPYGKYTETKQRWAAWQQAALTGVTADALRGVANRPRFRQLRADEAKVKDWINGVEGPEGFGALVVRDLAGTSSAVTAAELRRLEGVLRDQAVTAVGNAAQWRDALPVAPWAAAGANVRAPLEKHSEWLGQLVDFASNLDQLSEQLAGGFGWEDGVRETAVLLRSRAGVDLLAGRPGSWWSEAKELESLVDETAQDKLTAAAQSGGLSRKLMAWRRLGKVTGWPSGATDFDLDGRVVAVMRQLVGRDVKDAERRASLLEEMVTQTKLRFNRAARSAARAEAQLAEMFNRMQRAGLTEEDLDSPVAYNLALWNLKRADRNEKNLDRLRVRRDNFVNAVRAIGGGEIAALPEVARMLNELSALELKDDPNRPPTPSPGTAGWLEDLTNEGLGMVATWKAPGARSVPLRLEFSIVRPKDDTPPFYLAHRAISVGEFLELMNGRPKDAEVVRAALSDWAQKETRAKPYDVPIGWYPRPGTDFKVVELSDSWIPVQGSLVQGLLANTELYATVPTLRQAAGETPGLKSPLQQVTQTGAKLFAEKMLGARLPTVKEWAAVLQETGTTAATGHLRGPNFQKLFDFIEGYKVEGVAWGTWRPNAGIYVPTTAFKDEGRAVSSTDETHFWFWPVDEGPKSGNFINLTGNVAIFLAGDKPDVFYVAGGSVLSPPGLDPLQPQKVVAGGGMVGTTGTGKAAYSDVGIRPAFDAPPGFKERFKLFGLVREQKYLTL